MRSAGVAAVAGDRVHAEQRHVAGPDPVLAVDDRAVELPLAAGDAEAAVLDRLVDRLDVAHAIARRHERRAPQQHALLQFRHLQRLERRRGSSFTSGLMICQPLGPLALLLLAASARPSWPRMNSAVDLTLPDS